MNPEKKILEIDRDYVRDYSSGKKIYQFDGEYLRDYASGKKS